MALYKSKFEALTAAFLKEKGVKFSYESHEVSFTQERKYYPDFKIGNIFVETKGYFKSADRGKHLLIKQQNPKIDIRFVFMNPYLKLSRVSKTTYADWCDKHGFKWAHSTIPKEWIVEASNKGKARRKVHGP